MKIEVNGTMLPVDPRFVPVCTLDANGNPTLLSSSGGGGGLPVGAATESKQTQQISLATLGVYSQMGFYGSEFVGDTAAHSGKYLGLVVIEDAEIDTIVLGGDSSGGSALEGVPLAAGQQIIVRFTEITLSQGVVQLVKAPDPFPS